MRRRWRRSAPRLPLALRAAGSRLAEQDELAVGEYLRRLKIEPKRLKELGEVGPVLGLSYDLLNDGLKAGWRQLAVFPGDFEPGGGGGGLGAGGGGCPGA